MKKQMTVGQALQDPTTALAKAAAQCEMQRQERLAKAREIVASTGCTLEEAIKAVWGV